MADEPTVATASPPTAAEQIAAVKLDPARAGATDAKSEPQTLRDVLGHGTVSVVDANGVTHNLPSLRLRDIEDLEAMIGGMPNFLEQGHQIEHAITVIWLSARNEGLTREQRLKRTWKRTRDDVGDMFVLSVPQILALASDVLRNSGFIIKVSRGPLAEAPAETTGESSSPAA